MQTRVKFISIFAIFINKEVNIFDKNYINKITKGVSELGSILDFTVALALEKKLSTQAIIKVFLKKLNVLSWNIQHQHSWNFM